MSDGKLDIRESAPTFRAMTFPIRLTTGLVALAACIALPSCESTKKSDSDDDGIVDYTTPSSRKSDAEKASFPFDDAGNYREDWVAKGQGVTGVRDTPTSPAYTQTSTSAAYTQEPDDTPVRRTVASSSSSGARKSSGGSGRSTASRPKPKPRPKPVAKPTYVKVTSGDTLYGFSKRYGVSVASIKAANGLKSDTIVDGKSLKIPKKK